MAIIRKKDIRSMTREEIERKIKELELELIRIMADKAKKSYARSKQIKRTIARLYSRIHSRKK